MCGLPASHLLVRWLGLVDGGAAPSPGRRGGGVLCARRAATWLVVGQPHRQCCHWLRAVLPQPSGQARGPEVVRQYCLVPLRYCPRLRAGVADRGGPCFVLGNGPDSCLVVWQPGFG